MARLTDAQKFMLDLIARAGPGGYQGSGTNRSFRAMERAGVIVAEIIPDRMLAVNWKLTDAGRQAHGD